MGVTVITDEMAIVVQVFKNLRGSFDAVANAKKSGFYIMILQHLQNLGKYNFLPDHHQN